MANPFGDFLHDVPLELGAVLSCLRPSPPGKPQEQPDLLADPRIDWDLFLKWVDRHQVAPQIYGRVNQFKWSAVPESVQVRLQDRFMRNTVLAGHLGGETVRLVQLFHDNGIEVIVLKGVSAALMIHGALPLRHAGDIDLLVDIDQVYDAERLLVKNGYRSMLNGFELKPAQRGRYVAANHHFLLVRCNGTAIAAELHWRLTNSRVVFPVDFQAVAAEAETLALAGCEMRTLGPDHMLLFCFVHGALHVWASLFWLCDAAELVAKTQEQDWNRLIGRAENLRIMRHLAQGVLLAHVLLQSPLPDQIRLYAESDKMMPRLVRRAVGEIVNLDVASWVLLYHRAIHEFKLSAEVRYKMESLWQYIERQVINPRDWKLFPLPDSLFPLYYLIGPFTWVARRIREWI